MFLSLDVPGEGCACSQVQICNARWTKGLLILVDCRLIMLNAYFG
jgi:hypothetical protein